MENASKALIIAGSILIAILIISLGVLIFSQYSESARSAANMDKQEIAEFNSKIAPYIGDSVPGSQVNALIGYVISNDTGCKSSGDYSKAITLNYNNGSNSISISASKDTGLQISDKKRVPTGAREFYRVEVAYGDTGLINRINITHK